MDYQIFGESTQFDLGVNSFITKPVTLESLVDVMKTLQRYLCEIVELPEQQAEYENV